MAQARRASRGHGAHAPRLGRFREPVLLRTSVGELVQRLGFQGSSLFCGFQDVEGLDLEVAVNFVALERPKNQSPK